MLQLVRTHLKPLLMFSPRRSRQNTENAPQPVINTRSILPFHAFNPCSIEEVICLIQKVTNKQCQLDPILARVVKQCCDLLAPAIATIIYNSSMNGGFLNSLKSAIVRPIIKKANMDPFDLKSWRPILNLSFISKLVEGVAVSRFNEHMRQYNLLPSRQSEYPNTSLHGNSSHSSRQ